MKNISCIETLSTCELYKLSDLDLRDLSNKVEESFNWVKGIKIKLEDAIQIKYENTARAELQQQKKDFGTVTINNGKFVIKTEISKKVVWNQNILADVFEKMEPEIRRDIFNVTYAIDEKKYARLQPNMQAAVNPARTTQPGKIKIIIKEKED